MSDHYWIEREDTRGKVQYAHVLDSLGQALMQLRRLDDIDRAMEVFNESLMLLEQMGSAGNATPVEETLQSLS